MQRSPDGVGTQFTKTINAHRTARGANPIPTIRQSFYAERRVIHAQTLGLNRTHQRAQSRFAYGFAYMFPTEECESRTYLDLYFVLGTGEYSSATHNRHTSCS